MFPCSFLPVVFLLCAVGTAIADSTTQQYTIDGRTVNKTSTTLVPSLISVTASSYTSSNHLTRLENLPPSTTVADTTRETTTEESTEPSTAHAETTFAQPRTESRTTTASVSSNVTKSRDVTTSTPDVSAPALTSGRTISTGIQVTNQATNTMTGNTTLTHSTEPPSGNTTASSTTTILSTGITISGTTLRPTDVTTTNSTISNSTTIPSTSHGPTFVPTNNSTIGNGTTITSTTHKPTDVPAINSTVGTGTTITSTTHRPSVTTNNSTTTLTSTISTGNTITSTIQQPTDVTTNNSTTTPTSTISTGTTTNSPTSSTAPTNTITSTTQRPTDVTTNNSTISNGTTITSPTHRPSDIVTTNNSTTTLTSTISTGTTTNSATSSPTTTIISSTTKKPTETTTNNPTTAAPPIPPVIVCPAVPCPLESVCLNGTCQCLSGSFMVNGRCAPAQVFPGQLHLISLTFDNNMSNRSSKIFQDTATQISELLRAVLKNQKGYKQSEVVRLERGSVQATVNNIFEDTNATEESVSQAIEAAILSQPSGLLRNASYKNTNLCAQEPLPCEVSTTTCAHSHGKAGCSCIEGYIPQHLYSNTSCRACPSGERGVGDICLPCPFGYSGFNCNDSALLAVVVISCVLGGILLIVIALLIYGSCNRECTKSKPDYSSSPYSSGDLNDPWPTGVIPIPRASTNLDAVPPIEMSESPHGLVDRNQTNGMSGSYDLHPEGMHTFKGKTPSRYSYLVQGHENPYFLPGDNKNNG